MILFGIVSPCASLYIAAHHNETESGRFADHFDAFR
jgi:hypothetical protein